VKILAIVFMIFLPDYFQKLTKFLWSKINLLESQMIRSKEFSVFVLSREKNYMYRPTTCHRKNQILHDGLN